MAKSWKKLTQPGDKYTFLQGLVAKGYKSISDMDAICDTTNATISQNLTPLLLDRLDLLLKKVHKIKDTSIRQEILSKVSKECPICGVEITLFVKYAFHHCHLCGLLIDFMCARCNQQEHNNPFFRDRFCFGRRIQSLTTAPYQHEVGKCPCCDKSE